MYIWHIHFGWPGGDVYGNLIASVVWAVPAAALAGFHWIRHIRRQEARHAETHQLLRELHALLGASSATDDQEGTS